MSDAQNLAVSPGPSPRLGLRLRARRRLRYVVLGLLIGLLAYEGRWDWLPGYMGRLAHGIAVTLALLVSSCCIGFILAFLLGLAQASGPRLLAWPARAFCTVIRGTPLLLQLWMMYYGLGAVFSNHPAIRSSIFWPYLREAWPYGLAALVLSYAGYVGEVMRGALVGVPRGELEAARAFGMGRRKLFWRIWAPRAVQRALPTLMGETIIQLKATPLVATVTVIDVFAVISKVRQDTFLTYEPLLLLAGIYMSLTVLLTLAVRAVEARIVRR